MAFKFPGANIGLGAIGDIVSGRSVGDAVGGAVSTGARAVLTAGSSATQNRINQTISKIESKIGVGLGRPSLDKILNDPFGALGDLLPTNIGADDTRGGWMPRLQNRADPLMEIDWVPLMPLGLEPEFVEEIQWSHARFSAASGIFHHGQRIYMIEGIEHAPITVTFYEDRLMTVTSWLYKWKSLQFDEYYRTFGWADDYKLPIVALMKDVKGNTIGRVLFQGTFPTAFPQVNNSSEGSNRVRLQVEFSVDRVVFESFGGGSANGGTSSWMSIIENGGRDIMNAAFGDMKTTVQPAIDKVNGYIGSAKSAAKGVFDKLAGSIRF